MYKICVYVPEKHVETVKQALFDAGAGRIGNYDSCCWQTEGTGQFRPLQNSNPAIGSLNQVEQVREIKIELVCEDDLVKQAVQAMRKNHPYEEPAFDVWQLAEF
ncbi:MAG: YqfO family protein [Gammaproteobacteria bacterium]|nr:YqfO family protein [Gammaproteobacteria bacterium]MBT8134658.1 YqfO family protein [Gammaproteobacteria bacterium]NNJ48999.1 NGG1p interacting factor NIF3 [Gammaproteobacteria bacterium]